ncbi:HNH/endonuclease VII fold putative polymorphic toxin [Cedecea neteri]|uniref:HNH/endonuclease VII fold putative polymorphic toxin n=1 Tax=Cedecea neteri TaxID=158822 RepID=UPI0008FF9C19|nr:HNH/endonuclease VII fold putative polymorphic toxin [Cedecea neteri]
MLKIATLHLSDVQIALSLSTPPQKILLAGYFIIACFFTSKSPGPTQGYILGGGGTQKVFIRDDAGGHFFADDPSQNRGPHFNDEKDNHYKY